ncbi:alpha/beta fold hydrolase [Rhodococcus wratislaviensis]|uniref:Putative hydrolase n=1 Tax=Rhodococcus wratislaviensis NBRC 100605 TaxID=1219028 RepID=X0Q096_RHOWR|nr:alpha/beta fold hydrolase [Rhodococcus wratislaviensis]GAF43531.1 putative hydrolase [Rhodococcus wratislaviensis NBRC 100605]
MTHVVESGSGPALLLLHGIGGSADSFTPQFDELSSSLRLLAWDAPGYGRSEDPGRPFDLDDYADAAADVIRDRCGDAGAHVLGMSWGGVIATRLAMRHPGLVRSLLLGSSTVGSGADDDAAARMLARAATLEQEGSEAFAAERAPSLLSGTADDELTAKATAIMASSIRLPGYGYAAESMAATDHTADLPKIDIPTLVLGGDEDGVTGVPASQVLAGGIPGAVFVTIRGAGHLANQERPEAFNAWVESFIHITERLRNHL